MTVQIVPMTDEQAGRVAGPLDDGGIGCLRTERGNLPLAAVDVKTDVTGLVYSVELTQQFVNTHDRPLEATYIFPLPDRAAVTGMKMVAADRTVEAKLQERAEARETYDRAIAAGQRASIAEEDRPDVFTMRVGNIVPGEQVSVILTLAGPLSISDGAALFRFPLVVAPRYIPGAPLGGEQAGDGWSPDTDAVPDASRITPPVLLPGFPNPVRLSIDVGVDPGGLPLGAVRSSLHAVSEVDGRWRIAPGERADRDFVLRLDYDNERTEPVLALHKDDGEDGGTFELTVLPPAGSAPPRPRDVVLVLDRSGSMAGWKMVSARRAAARIVDTLTDADRFAVLTFDHVVDTVEGLPAGLVAATDRNRFRAVRHLSTVDARGGTEMLAPLREGRALLNDRQRDLVLVLVTDGQVGNEDQILGQIGDLTGIRVHTIGIDRAVNAGFLGRLASAGGGRFELVESEDQLDDVMAHIHRRVGSPLVTGVSLGPAGLSIVDGTVTPTRLPDLFPGVPLVIRGRYTGAGGRLAVRGTAADGTPWQADVTGERHDNAAATAIWARAHVRDLEDAYAVTARTAASDLERRIVAASLRFGVLCRFTAYVAVDDRVVAEGGTHKVVQPVEPVSGWEMAQPVAYGAPRPAPMAAQASTGGLRRMMGRAAGAPRQTGGANYAMEAELSDGLLDRAAPPSAAQFAPPTGSPVQTPPAGPPVPAPPPLLGAPPAPGSAPVSGGPLGSGSGPVSAPPFGAAPFAPPVPGNRAPEPAPKQGPRESVTRAGVVGAPAHVVMQVVTGARDQLQRLRAAADRSAADRLVALRTIGRWLSGVATELRLSAPTDPTLTRYADLSTELLGTPTATPDLWSRTEAALAELAGETPGEQRGELPAERPGAAPAGGAAGRERRPFWKR
ncbi:VIT domain-containing protein [Virgisporangium aurantiacum]|uniref:Ca-activated chloride channel family protein n=1 Tax=Virgisporangium aurantiacum TaxID=175570 RepID=A0A8J3ZAP5_9ACTN|nr:VIT domain-containing protein [Virgisporangium aurantiacum]GIJ58236.1 hypothetical protein Vau01_057520 [Virgisporangium aurantiacum]